MPHNYMDPEPDLARWVWRCPDCNFMCRQNDVATGDENAMARQHTHAIALHDEELKQGKVIAKEMK